MRVNQRQLAEILERSDETIRQLQDEGLPIAVRGARGESNVYETGAVIDWLIAQALARAGTSEQRLRRELLEHQVADARMKRGEREGKLVPVDQVDPIWQGRVIAAAAYMTGRASRLAGILETAPGIEGKRSELMRSDAQFLEHLGVHGERIQTALEAFLARLPAEDVAQLYAAMNAPGGAGEAP